MCVQPKTPCLCNKYEPTPPQTLECNRKVERVNRTLNNMIRAMLAQANMPNSFWAPAMKATAYLRNRLPRSALDDEIPYEHWYGNSLQKKASNYSNHLAALSGTMYPKKIERNIVGTSCSITALRAALSGMSLRQHTATTTSEDK